MSHSEHLISVVSLQPQGKLPSRQCNDPSLKHIVYPTISLGSTKDCAKGAFREWPHTGLLLRNNCVHNSDMCTTIFQYSIVIHTLSQPLIVAFT